MVYDITDEDSFLKVGLQDCPPSDVTGTTRTRVKVWDT